MSIKKETIRWGSTSSATFSPERGGMITSLILGGKEILFMDEVTFVDTKSHVHGGIPIMFPNAGIVESPQYPKLLQHGFARSSSNWKGEIKEGSFVETLESNEETLTLYPYKFLLEVEGRGEGDTKFTLIKRVTNRETNKHLPISMGLHPYFPVPKEKKEDVQFNFVGGDFVRKDIQTWSMGGTTFIDNPGHLRVTIPDLGTLLLEVSSQFKRIWVWSAPLSDFICIEPTMRDPGGLVKEPELIGPGKTLEVSFSIGLE